MSSNIVSGLTIAVLALALVLGGLGAGVVISGKNNVTVISTTTVAKNSTASPFVVNLVITTGSIFNSTAGDQPAFFVLGEHGLVSAADIRLPTNRTIEFVITNYDDGNANLTMPDDNGVRGTIGGTMFVASNDNINSSQGAAGIVLKGGEQVSSVPNDTIAHTFEVPSLGLNIPIPVSSTVVAFFTIAKAGTFQWFCMTLCGDAAMSTPGWMTGSVTASG